MVSITDKQTSLNQQLDNAMNLANRFVTKNYMDQLEQYDILEPSFEDLDIDMTKDGQIYHLSKLVYSKDESFLEKLTTIMNVASSIGGTVVSIIESDGDVVQYYLGVVAKQNRQNNEIQLAKRESMFTAFRGAIKGNLIGSEVHVLNAEQAEQLITSISSSSKSAVSSISGIVSLREDSQKGLASYVQGIENVVDSLRGQAYSIVFIADPVNHSEIQAMKQGYELIYSQLVTYLKNTITFNESDSATISKATSEGVAKGITKGISLTQSKGTSSSFTFGGSLGVTAGINIGIPGIAGINTGVSAGVNASRTRGTSESISEGKTFGSSEQSTSMKSETFGTSISNGISMQLSYENKSVQAMLDKINLQLKRLDSCENYGAFNCAAYILTENPHQAVTVSANYNALFRGENSHVQASFINSWTKKSDVDVLLQYMKSFVHPQFKLETEGIGEEEVIVSPASMMNSKEVALQIGLPKKSINGLAVIPMAAFGRNIPKLDSKQSIYMGKLYHMGLKEESDVNLDIKSLTAHTFITGSTGAGKSTTIYHMLRELQKKSIPFLVIEPVKGEYKNVFGMEKGVNVFGSNPSLTELLRINPFSFPEGIHILEHIDRLVEIFNVCWPMYAAMPAVLKEAIEQMYISHGWDLVLSTHYSNKPSFPNFIDLKLSLENVIQLSAYSDEVKSNYKGSLLTRVNSLTNGLNGMILNGDELAIDMLFDQSTIIDLSRIGSTETKALIMGMLVMKLQEYRIIQGGMNLPLKHVTVLEEAHHLLKRTSSEQSMEGSNLLGKSVEMLANAIAEMRTYGEGFIIADQAPGLMDLSVIRNTNTKIILQTPEFSDRQLVGKASNMNDEQINELAKLTPGVAAIYQNRWLEPVLCQIPRLEIDTATYMMSEQKQIISPQVYKKQLAAFLLYEELKEKLEFNVDWLENHLYVLPVSTKNRVVLQNLFDEYREKQKINFWNKNKFAQLATLVTETLDLNSISDSIEHSTNKMNNVAKDLHESIERRVHFENDHLVMRLSKCLLNHKSSQDKRWIEVYDYWIKDVQKYNLY